MKLYFCRHGQTTGDVEDRFGGDYDDQLTELGVSQAKDLANKLSDKGIKKIFTSPLIRAQQTAKLFKEKISAEIEIIPELKERNQNGHLSGMLRSEAKDKYPELTEDLKDYRKTIEGAESYDEACKRFETGLKMIANCGYNAVAVITHGGMLKYLLREKFGYSKFDIGDCSYLETDIEGDNLNLVNRVGIEISS